MKAAASSPGHFHLYYVLEVTDRVIFLFSKRVAEHNLNAGDA